MKFPNSISSTSSSQIYKKIMTSKARVNISTFKGLPISPKDKTITEEFIIASNDVISMMQEFGSFLKPVVVDMKKNLSRLETFYKEDKERRKFLEDLLLSDSEKVIHLSLIWLLRSLDLVLRFMMYVSRDNDIVNEKSNNLRPFIVQAYNEVLKPYHGYILQQTFSVSLSIID